MKTNKQIRTTKTDVLNSAGQSLPKPATSLEQVIAKFLLTMAPHYGRQYRLVLKNCLMKTLSPMHHLPIGDITTEQLRKVAVRPDITSCLQRRTVSIIRNFFEWSRALGYLPPGQPTPAEPLRLRLPKVPREILTPAELKRLFSGTTDAEVMLALALSAFAGIKRREIELLSWDCIAPGEKIQLDPARGMALKRLLPITPTLDLWLRPFYGSQGRVITTRDFAYKMHRLARLLGVPAKSNALRNSYCSYFISQSHNSAKMASESGHSLATLQHFAQPVTDAAAAEFFSLTPEAVGIHNWPEIVAIYLKQRLAMRSNGKPLRAPRTGENAIA